MLSALWPNIVDTDWRRLNTRWRQTRALLLCVAIVGMALCTVGRATVVPSGSKTRYARSDQPPVIRPLDFEGMKTLLGRPGGRRRPIVVYLFYTACRPCTDRLRDLQRLFEDYQIKGLDVALVSIAPMDDAAKLLDVLRPYNTSIPIFLLDSLDDDFAEEFFMPDWEPIVPSVFFYNSAGILQEAEVEADSINYSSLKRHAEKLLMRAHKD